MNTKNDLSCILILLAGGKSLRMGSAKGLLRYHDKYWIEEQLERAENANFDKVIIVLGHEQQPYFEKIPFLEKAKQKAVSYHGLNVKVVINDQPHLGTFSSLVAGLRSITSTNSVFLLPIDVPLISRNEIQKINNCKKEVCIPAYRNKKGHPVKLGYNFWSNLKLVSLEGKDARLDHQIKNVGKEHVGILEVNELDAVLNLNTLDQWNDFLKLNK